MTDTTEIILQIPCTRCGQVVAVPHMPNPFISEAFVRTMLVCDNCMHKTRREILTKLVPKVAQASLPYKDT